MILATGGGGMDGFRNFSVMFLLHAKTNVINCQFTSYFLAIDIPNFCFVYKCLDELSEAERYM